MEFKMCPRNAKLLSDERLEWRLASVAEVQSNLAEIKDKGILGSWDIARLLDGWVDGPGYRYQIRKEYKPNMGDMLLVKTGARRQRDGSFNTEMYSGVNLDTEGRKASVLLSCDDEITEVIFFVLNNIVDSHETATERQVELDQLMESLKRTFRNGRTVLHYAADQPHSKKYAELVARMLVKNFEFGKELVKAADKYGRTALHFAGLHGNFGLCRYLINECELKPGDADRNLENLLHFAVKSNKEDVVRDLFEFTEVQSIINSQDAKGKTPLHKAAANGNVKMIEILLSNIKGSRKKFIRQADLLGQTALHVAASGGRKGAVKCLLEKGSRPLAERNSDGKTALHYAVLLSKEERAIEVAELLLEKCRSDEERCLLLWASATGMGTAEESARSSSPVEKYLRAERERTANSSEDLLLSAIKLGNDMMALELINRGANTDHITNVSGNDQLRRRCESFLERIDKMPERGRDRPTIHDSLGRRAFAEGLAALFLNPYVKTPVTVGITGDWGMGKSSLMIMTEMILVKAAAQLAFPNLLQTEKFPGARQFKLSRKGRRKYQQIKKAVKHLTSRNDNPLVHFLDNYQDKYHDVYRSLAVMDRREMFHVKDETSDSGRNQYSLGKIPSILTVRYNAWQYQNGLEAWAGLAVQITKVIEETMTRAQRIRCRWRYAWREHQSKIWLELIIPCLLALFLSVWVAWVVWILLSRSKHKEVVGLKYGSIPVSIVVVVWIVVSQLLSVFKPISVQIMGYFSVPDHSTNQGYQNQVIKDIRCLKNEMGEKPSGLWKFIALEWLWKLFFLFPDTVEDTSIPKSPPPGKDDVRIIVFVDDLDRCEDTVILQVLSAVNLVLGVCEINVILGMDKKMIARAIANKFEDSVNHKMLNPIDLADKYISKIVQLPLALPDADDVETKKFLDKQLGEAFEVGSDDGTDSNDPEDAQTNDERGPDLLSKLSQLCEPLRTLSTRLWRCMPEQADTAAGSRTGEETNSNVPEGARISGDSQPLADDPVDHSTLDGAQNVQERRPHFLSKISQIFRLWGCMPEQAHTMGVVELERLNGEEPNSNVPEGAHAVRISDDSQPLADDPGDHSLPDVALNLQERRPNFLSIFFSQICRLCGCMPGSEEISPKLLSMPLNSLMLMPNYSYGEREAIDYLSTLATDAQKLPREWKRFLTYHRLAWNILSQSEQVKNWPGWQVQLIVWIFYCSQWKDQINAIIQKWKKLVLVNGVSVSGEGPSLKDIVEQYWDEQHHRVTAEEEEEQHHRGTAEEEEEQEQQEEEDDEYGEEGWKVLKETLTKYDVSMKCIQSFQKFRLYCDIGHLPFPRKLKDVTSQATYEQGHDALELPCLFEITDDD